MKKDTKSGFTLVEILIVVAIVGILATIAIPQYLGYLRTAKINACISNTYTAVNYIKYEVSKAAGQEVKTTDILTTLNQLTKKNPMDVSTPAYITSNTAVDCQVFIEKLTPTFTLPKLGSTVIVHGYTKNVSGELAKIDTPIIVE